MAFVASLYQRIPLAQSAYRKTIARFCNPWLRKANIPYSAAIRRMALRSGDPTRYFSIALAAETIKREGIEGSVAELGVYRGDLSVFLEAVLPNRKLYLFDTFSGFPPHDDGGYGNLFANTSVEAVRRRLYGNAFFRVGYFPDTAQGLEGERFSFVSLDADLYNPMLTGIRFFWPRISPGGYLFLHDFHSHFPVAKAVADARLSGVIELPDKHSSAVIRKPY